jgi:hypothetical protein
VCGRGQDRVPVVSHMPLGACCQHTNEAQSIPHAMGSQHRLDRQRMPKHTPQRRGKGEAVKHPPPISHSHSSRNPRSTGWLETIAGVPPGGGGRGGSSDKPMAAGRVCRRFALRYVPRRSR